jgi:hypothetical protein
MAGFPPVHTFHNLPSGDVRVIQSLPGDVRGVSKDNPCEYSDGLGDDRDVAPHGAGAGAFTALKFKCRREQMQQFIGACFHVGELISDAETESDLQSYPKRRANIAKSPNAGVSASAGCMHVFNCLVGHILCWMQACLEDPASDPRSTGPRFHAKSWW